MNQMLPLQMRYHRFVSVNMAPKDSWITLNSAAAGAADRTGAVGRGHRLGCVPGVRGAGTLHARQRHRLLERVEPLGVLLTPEQQRYAQSQFKTLKIHFLKAKLEETGVFPVTFQVNIFLG